MKPLDGLENIYIFNSKRKLVYVQDYQLQNTQIHTPEALSDFLSLINSLAHSLGEEKISSVEIGNSVIYTLQDLVKNILFVVKGEKSANRKKMIDCLIAIMNEFIEFFDGNFTKPLEEKEKLMKNFIKSLEKIYGESENVLYFLEELRIIL